MKRIKNKIKWWYESKMEEGGELVGMLVAFLLVAFGLLLSGLYITYLTYNPHKMPTPTCGCQCSQSR